MNFKKLFEEASNSPEWSFYGMELEFIEAIFREMEKQGVSQSELARRLRVNRSLVSRMMKGNGQNLTLKTLSRCAHALGCEMTVRIKMEKKS